MAISRVQFGGTQAADTSSISIATGSNVTAGNLLIIYGMKYSPSDADVFVVGDLTKTAGTATLGTITLDVDDFSDNGTDGVMAAVYSVPITGSGSLTLQITSDSGSYLAIAYEEVSGADTSGTRLEATNEATGNSGSPDSGNCTSAGGAIFCGCAATYAIASHTWTQDGAFTQIYEQETIDHVTAAAASRIVTTGTTDSASWTISTGYNWTAVCAVYKEATGGGGTEYTQLASGAVTPAGALAKRPSKILAGAITPAGVLARQASKILAGAITPAGTLTRQVSKFLAGAVGLAGGVANQAQKVLAGAVAPAGALTRQAQKVLGGSITPTGAITAVRTILAAVAGTLSLSGTLSKQTSKTFAGDITPAGGLINQAQKILGGAMEFVGSLSRQTGKALAGDITPAGAVTAVRTIIASLSGTLPFSGTLSKQTGKNFGGEIAPAGALARQVSLLLTGVLSFSGTLAKHTSKALVGALSLAGTLAGNLASSAIHYVAATLFLPQGAADLELPQGAETLHLPDGAADVEG